jgi:hypothetical protein
MSNLESKIAQTKKIEKREPLDIPEDLALIWGDLRFLKNKEKFNENPEQYKERSAQTYKNLTEFFLAHGATLTSDVNKIYHRYKAGERDSLIVRREDPEKVAGLMADQPIDLSFDPKVAGDRGDKYANCAIWPYGSNPVAGIRNAFLEGRGMAGPIVTLTAIRPNPKNNSIEKPIDHLLKVGDIDREAVRIVSGQIEKDDLEFVLLRMPHEFFPKENMTEEEIKEKPIQIFRAFNFRKQE